MTSKWRSFAARRLCWGAVAALANFAAFAQQPVVQQQTQTEASTPAQLQEVIVTGSRIALPNMTSTSPIEVVTEKDIQVGGRNDISDVIMQLPQNFNNAFADFNNRTSGLTTAGGLATADLRGLGPQRTLVLVNGRRLGPADANTANPNQAADLDQIPTALIERVDVVTGGASSVYGSDAIGGVINFVMKRNFEGVQVDGQYGSNWHHQHSDVAAALQEESGQTPDTGTIFDGRNRQFDVLMGSSIAEGKGNVTGYFSYLQTNPVPSGNRDFGGCQLDGVPDATGNITSAECLGSSNSNFYQPYNTGPQYSVLGNQFVTRGSANTNPPANFNSQPYIYTGRDDLRYNAGFFAHVDVNDWAKPYMEFGFMNDRTDQKVAPSALFRLSNPLDPTGNGNYNVNCDNPLLSSQEAGLLCSPAQQAYVGANPGQACIFNADGSSPNCSNVQIGRRNTEGGGREAFFEHTNFRVVGGIKGNLGASWSYDAYAQYYYTEFFNSNSKYLNFQNIDNALQVKGTAAAPVCISGPPCVPYNIWQDGGVTDAALQYLYIDGTSYGTNSQRIEHIDVTGDLGSYGIKSPLASDGLSVNVGYEHRNEEMAYDPDSAEQSGLLSGFGGAAAAIHAGYKLNEEFVELGGPIAQDQPGIKTLFFDAGFRTSNYSTTGHVDTGKFEVQYQPIADIKLRGSFQRAIRAPNLIELYNPLSVGQITSGDDPCAPNEFTGKVAASLQQCLRSVPNSPAAIAAFTALYNSQSIPQGAGSQLTEELGGNTQLKPERANSFNIGATLTPQFLPDFTGSIDYFHIKLSDEITTVPPSLILQQCLSSGDPFYCDKIVRNPVNFGLTGASVAGGGYIVQTDLNIAQVTVEGIDLQGHYLVHLPAGLGNVGIAMNGSYLLKSETQPVPGVPGYDCAGLFGAECQTVNPRWRHTMRATWGMPWNTDVSLTWRFIGKVGLDNNDPNPLLFGHTFVNQNTGGGAYNYYNASIPNYSYLDLSLSYTIVKGVEVRGGINNLFDKDPPLITSEIVSGGAANTFETYDTFGRELFVAFTAKF
jgi:iron complex outermembrane recepter protein